MENETYLNNQIDVAEYKSQYDAFVKRILSDKQVLAHIMVGVIPEFRNYSIADAAACIETEPEVEVREIRPGATNAPRKPEAIRGVNTEDAIPYEGRVTFDVVFTVRLKNDERQKIYINVEAQKSYYTGYDLVTRGIFYPARILSSQMDVEFCGEDYDNIKKVYSIWICMDAPEVTHKGEVDNMQVADAIVKYAIQPEIIYAEDKLEKVYTGRYDLFSSYFIYLRPDETEKSKNKLIGMLTVLLSQQKSAATKKAILENEYGMKMSVDVAREVDKMCNLSDIIEERGIQKGIQKGIEKGKLEAIVNMLEFGVPEEKILEKYSQEELAQAKVLRGR